MVPNDRTDRIWWPTASRSERSDLGPVRATFGELTPYQVIDKYGSADSTWQRLERSGKRLEYSWTSSLTHSLAMWLGSEAGAKLSTASMKAFPRIVVRLGVVQSYAAAVSRLKSSNSLSYLFFLYFFFWRMPAHNPRVLVVCLKINRVV
jgi:hypothetical protein